MPLHIVQRSHNRHPCFFAGEDYLAYLQWVGVALEIRAALAQAATDDIRLALNQSQPLGSERFYAKIERITGQRREARPRGRPL